MKKSSKKVKELKIQGEEARARANFGTSRPDLKQKQNCGNELKKSAKLYAAEKNKIGAAVVRITS